MSINFIIKGYRWKILILYWIPIEKEKERRVDWRI